MENDADSFAARLRALREQKGLSQYALARKSGLSKQAVSHLEGGIREPTWQTVQLLAKALGVHCSEFEDTGLELPETEPPGKPGRPRKPEDTPPVEPDPVQAKPVADPVPRPSAATVKGQKAKPAKGKATGQEPPAAKGKAKKTRKRKGG